MVTVVTCMHRFNKLFNDVKLHAVSGCSECVLTAQSMLSVSLVSTDSRSYCIVVGIKKVPANAKLLAVQTRSQLPAPDESARPATEHCHHPALQPAH